MRQPIYLDILFLLNMLVTFLLLSAASHLAAVRTKRWRMILAVLLGGVFSLLIFVRLNPFESFFEAYYRICTLCRRILAKGKSTDFFQMRRMLFLRKFSFRRIYDGGMAVLSRAGNGLSKRRALF